MLWLNWMTGRIGFVDDPRERRDKYEDFDLLKTTVIALIHSIGLIDNVSMERSPRQVL